MSAAVAGSAVSATLDVAAVQAALEADGLDGWLLYDFRGLNPIAADVTGVDRQGGHLATRRWYYLIPGQRRAARRWSTRSSATRSRTCPARPSGTPGASSSRRASRRLLHGHAARRDGVFARLRDSVHRRASTPARSSSSGSCGVEVVSSGDLVQRFSAVWDAAAIATHREASEKLLPRQGPRVRRDRARARATAVPTTEYDIQQLMAGWFARRRARQRFATRTCRPRRTPATRTTCRPPTASRAIRADELVLLDLWGKLDRPGAVFADITWVGFTGTPRARALRAGVRARSRRARRRGRAGAGARHARAASCAAGRSTARASAVLRGRRLRRPHPAPHRATASANRCTATASTWTTTKPTTTGGCCPAPASRSNPASTFTTSASGRKST